MPSFFFFFLSKLCNNPKTYIFCYKHACKYHNVPASPRAKKSVIVVPRNIAKDKI